MQKPNFSALKELLEEIAQIDHGKNGPKIQGVIEQMEGMLHYLEDLAYLSSDQERAEVLQKALACRQASTQGLQELFAEQGISYEELQSYFADPKNLQPKEWATMQAMQQKIASAVHPS